MSKKNRTHQVQAPGNGGKGKYHCGTITVEDQLKADRAARRQAQIESGTFCRGGIHGGDKNAQKKRARRDGKRAARNWQND
jgi:hypothetical protein